MTWCYCAIGFKGNYMSASGWMVLIFIFIKSSPIFPIPDNLQSKLCSASLRLEYIFQTLTYPVFSAVLMKAS